MKYVLVMCGVLSIYFVGRAVGKYEAWMDILVSPELNIETAYNCSLVILPVIRN